MKNNSFVALILTHGRPDNVHTIKTLRKCGYTGDIIIVLDNEDDPSVCVMNEFTSKIHKQYLQDNNIEDTKLLSGSDGCLPLKNVVLKTGANITFNFISVFCVNIFLRRTVVLHG
jgi:hypothetical protein